MVLKSSQERLGFSKEGREPRALKIACLASDLHQKETETRETRCCTFLKGGLKTQECGQAQPELMAICLLETLMNIWGVVESGKEKNSVALKK